MSASGYFTVESSYHVLVANRQSLGATLEDEITHKTAGSILNEETLLLGIRSGGQLENNVLQRSSLSGGPVNTGHKQRGACGSKIDDKVVDLAPKHIGGKPGLGSSGLVLYGGLEQE